MSRSDQSSSTIQSHDCGEIGVGAGIIGASIGGIVGFKLSFTTLPPLVAGGIIGAVPAVLACAVGCYLLYSQGGKLSMQEVAAVCIYTTISSAIGACCAAALNAAFPEVMLGAGSAVLAGAAIGAISLAALPLLVKAVELMSKPKSSITVPEAAPSKEFFRSQSNV